MDYKSFSECVDFVGSACKPFSGQKKYISTGAVDTDHITEADVEIIDYENRPSRANLEVSKGDSLFAKMQGTKKTLAIDDALSNNVYSTGFCAVRAKKGVLTDRCLYHLLTSRSFLDQKDKNCSGATQKAITNADLSKITIRVPDYHEQEVIAKRLDTIASIIKHRLRELQSFDDLIKARFVEMFGDPVNNEKEWSTKPLDDICRTIVDCPHSTPNYTSEDTGYMCIRTSIVKKNRILWNEIEYIPEDEYKKRIQRKKPEKGDIIYTREGAILGIAAIIDRDCNVALGQRSMLLSPDLDKCTSEFLSVAMNFESFLSTALKGMSGSASPHINVGDIKAFKMILPPLEQQKWFSCFIEQIDKSKFVVIKKVLFVFIIIVKRRQIMFWTALSAIGTIVAAFVGITGIWLNLWDKKKRLNVSFEAIPTFSVYVSNGSLRSVVVTKMVCTVDSHVFYVKTYDGLQEVCLNPTSVRKIEINKNEIYHEYFKCQLDALCNPKDEVIIILHDNYGRKYKIKTGFGISAFQN